MSAGCWLGWPSPTVPKLVYNKTDMVVNLQQVSWIVASMEIGQILSPVPSGYLADLLGRKLMLLLTAVLFYATWVLAGLASSADELYVARFLAGVGTGVVFTVVPVYLGEIASAPLRGSLSIVFTNFLELGILIQFGVGPHVSYNMLAFFSGAVSVVFFGSFLFMPDSPYFLMMKNRENDAREALMWLRCLKVYTNEKGDLVDPTDREIQEIRAAIEEDRRNKGRFYDLISTAENRRATMIVMVLCAFQKLCGISCLISYSSTTLPDWDGVVGANDVIILFGFILATCNFLSAPLVDRLGRRPLIMLSGIGCGVASGLSAIFYYLHRETKMDTTAISWMPHICLISLGVTQSFGVVVIPVILLGELFPTGVRSFAAAVASIVMAGSSFLVNKLYLTISVHIGIYANFVFFSVMGFLCAIFSYFFVFETKGKSFVEIQRVLKRSDSTVNG